MKPYIASLINALVLIAMSLWAYTTADSPSVTALIPGFFGIVLMACLPGVKKENKIIAHVAVTLTLIVFIALFMPLRGAINREDAVAIFRVSLMLITTLIAMVAFIKSFIDVRKKRKLAEAAEQ